MLHLGVSASATHDGFVPTSFGDLLRYLRRRAQLTQRDLGIAVGYSEAHINRFEKNKRLPDPMAVAALFVPALDLKGEPGLAQRLIELARSKEPLPPEPSEPLPAVLEAIPPAPPFEAERPDALARLRARLTTERRVVLAGLPGMGKTSLAAALAREYASSMPVFWLTLTEGVTTFVDSLIYQLATFAVAHGQAQANALIQPIGSPSSFPLDRRLALLSAALSRDPSLLCFDNAELIAENQAALQVLRHLSATATALMMLTSRESLPLTQVGEMQLAGMDRTEGRALINRLAKNQIAPDVADRLLDKTGGNPMLLRLAVSQFVESHTDLTVIEQLEAQPQVTSYLLETVQKQSSIAEWKLLSLLSVFQKPIDLYDERLLEQMQTLRDSRGVTTAIPDLQRRHLIDHPTRAELHPTIRDYVYRSLSSDPTRRRRLHRLAADWYVDQARRSLSAAFHYAAAGLLDQAVETIMHDEKGIVARGEVLAAVAVLDDLVARHEKRRTLSNDLLRQLLGVRGDLLTATLRSADAEADFRRALELAANPAVRADLVCRMSMVLMQRGHLTDALQLIQSARNALAPDDKFLHARLLGEESQVLEMLGRYEEAQAVSEQAIALADDLAAVSPVSAEEIRCQVYSSLANIARAHRQMTVAIEHAQRWLASAHKANLRIKEISALSFIGGMMYDSGDLEGALRYRQEAVAGAEAIEDQVGVGFYLTHVAAIDLFLMHPEAGLEKLDRAIRILEDTGETRGLASALSSSASHLMLQGKVAQARTAMRRVLTEMDCPATLRSWGYYLAKLAMLELVDGNTGAAQSALAQAFARPYTLQDPMLAFELRTTLALAQAVEGKADAAQMTLDESPRSEGLSIWSTLDRDLVDSCVAYACGRSEQALQITARVAQSSGSYPYYYQAAVRLTRAIQNAAPVSALPRLLGVAVN